MKIFYYSSILFLFASLGCKTTPPQTLTIDGLTMTLPEGFDLQVKDNTMGYDGIPALENTYTKMDGGNTVSLKINRLNIAHVANEDPDFLTEKCLTEHCIFYSELYGEKYKIDDAPDQTINGKKALVRTFLHNDDSITKGDILAIKVGNNVIILHYQDFANHYDKAKGDWEAIKNSLKF